MNHSDPGRLKAKKGIGSYKILLWTGRLCLLISGLRFITMTTDFYGKLVTGCGWRRLDIDWILAFGAPVLLIFSAALLWPGHAGLFAIFWSLVLASIFTTGDFVWSYFQPFIVLIFIGGILCFIGFLRRHK